MMATVFDLINPLAGAVLQGLINTLWQGALLAGLGWCLLRALRGTNATTRYALWLATLAAVLLLPLLSLLRAETGGHASATAQPAAAERNAAREDIQLDTSTNVAAFDAVAARVTPGEALNDATPRAPRFQVQVFAGPWASVVVLLYLAAAVWMLLRVARGYCYLRRLKREAEPLGGAHAALLDQLRRTFGVVRHVSLAASREVTMPLAAGLRRAVIIIPRHLIEELSDEEFEQVLLHELAHIRRYDDWTNLFQKLVEALLFFHPAVLFVCARLNLEREIACDDWVVWTTGARKPYANCLTRLLELVITPRPATPAPGAAVVRRHVFRRVELLLDKRRNTLPRLSRASCLAMFGVLSAVVLQCVRVPPVFAVSGAPKSVAAADAAQSAEDELRQTSLPDAPATPAASAASNASADATRSQSRASSVLTAASNAGLASRRTAQSNEEESKAEFERRVQAAMEPQVQEIMQQAHDVMQPKLNAVQAEAQQLMEPRLQEIAGLPPEEARERRRELQKEVDTALGAKMRAVEKEIDQLTQPRIYQLEKETRARLTQQKRGEARQGEIR